MGKVKNIQLKELLAMLSAGVITLAGTGCSIGGKKNDDGKNNSIVSIDEQTETVLSTIETTTTLKPFDKNSGCINHFDDDTSVVSDYVQTSYESDLTVSDITSTTAKSTDIIAEANKNDNTAKTSKSTIVKPTTTNVRITKTSANTTKTTVDTTRTTNTTKTTKPTTKTTTITTNAATPKPTTTVTTTTTEAVTEPVVTEPEEVDCDIYDLNNIGISKKCFKLYGGSLRSYIVVNRPSDAFVTIDIGYGSTAMAYECYLILQSLNNICCDNEYINVEIYKKIDADYLNNCKYFMYNFKDVQDVLECDIDYAYYTINKTVGNYLNDADQAYRDGRFDDFMNDTILSGNVSPDVLDNPGAMAILYSYDKGQYLNYDDVDSKLNVVVNHINEQAFGYGYSK